MENLVSVFTSSLDAVHAAANALPTKLETVKALDDETLLVAGRTLSEMRRAIDACASLVAGEVSFRSRRDLGYSGLAQSQGFRTAEALIQHTSGSTARDASTLVSVGVMVHDALSELSGDAGVTTMTSEPWLTAVGAAVNTGTISVDAAKAIRSGLGEPSADATDGVTSDELGAAADRLLLEAPTLDADRLFRRAREVRDELDARGIVDRERELYQERSMRRVRRPNGLNRYILDPDLESAAFWDDVYDTLTSPRRGGARFVDASDKQWADAVATDPRTTAQYVHDALTQLLRIAVHAETADSHRVIGSRQPAVRILVTAESLTRRTGHGRIEGCDIPVSIETVERVACTSGTVAVLFDEDGQAINLGREQRLYNNRQRIALAARDGGCRWPECDRPPSWTEAHHVRHWQRDHGKTDLADGLLLCRHHHLLLHNNHWEIRRQNANYWLIPPPDIDPTQTSRLMPSKSAALRDLQRARRAS